MVSAARGIANAKKTQGGRQAAKPFMVGLGCTTQVHHACRISRRRRRRFALFDSPDRRAELDRFTVKEVKDTLDSIKLADLKPLVSRVFSRGEGVGLIQGNLQFREVDT